MTAEVPAMETDDLSLEQRRKLRRALMRTARHLQFLLFVRKFRLQIEYLVLNTRCSLLKARSALGT